MRPSGEDPAAAAGLSRPLPHPRSGAHHRLHADGAAQPPTASPPAGFRVALPYEFWEHDAVFELADLTVSYAGRPALAGVSMAMHELEITALIGPSGCGKSTLLRSLNRLTELVPGSETSGRIRYRGADAFAPQADPVALRRRVGLVAQRPAPFRGSIFDNVAFGLRLHHRHADLDSAVEFALRRCGLWEEVGGRLRASAASLSGGQQQRLCIARAVAVEPDVLLLDEPCGALDPISTGRIEDLLLGLRDHVTIVIVTHNMQQAARISDVTAVLLAGDRNDGAGPGRLVEYDATERVFTDPADARTAAYVTGRLG